MNKVVRKDVNAHEAKVAHGDIIKIYEKYYIISRRGDVYVAVNLATGNYWDLSDNYFGKTVQELRHYFDAKARFEYLGPCTLTIDKQGE